MEHARFVSLFQGLLSGSKTLALWTLRMLSSIGVCAGERFCHKSCSPAVLLFLNFGINHSAIDHKLLIEILRHEVHQHVEHFH